MIINEDEHCPLKPGGFSVLEIKKGTVDDTAPNPFLKYHLASNERGASEIHGNKQFTPTVTTSLVTPFKQSGQATLNGTPRPTNTIQRRNHERLNNIVARLQNFNGSVTELVAIASVQQQLDVAFTDLDRAKDRSKDVFHQFELQGHISNRQCQKKNGATRDLTRASHRIAQLTKELWDLQRCHESSGR
ncbi:hypothetical protein E0Z10_g7775 [Xylaria hypoxylon]|uniref:Uncharacterized protein n=1 Tax=Xylaria hypoxylon TaxID=37992 RepID=A0A4Z0YD07_9PEZI|nr:hypothetical protein E0Z10_g7775 [Xylaria hypoxylon]